VDEGSPVSYLLLARATPVYGSDGEAAGLVKKVLCEPAADIFDGLLLATPYGNRYIPAERVAAIHERGVDLSITCAEVADSPPPRPPPRVKWDLDEPPARLWHEIQSWLLEHLPHQHPARDVRLQRARERLANRAGALRLARENPELALEVGVGRPDLPGADHGGVVDMNHAPVAAIKSLPGLDEHLAHRILDTRGRVSGFASLEDLGMVLDLPGDQVERLRGHVVFLPT
jgi:DNA uptake protein ComE-like DNA-binding protein